MLGLAGVLGLALIGVASTWQVPRAPARAVVMATLERAPADGLPWLALQQRHIVDDTGRRALLRGFNTTALLDWPREPVAAFDEDDAELMRRSGFNVVRLPFAWSSLEPTRGRINPVYLERIATTVDMLNRHGL